MTTTDISAYASLGADINKSKTDPSLETKQGIVSQKLPELDLAMGDEEIIKLTMKWEKDWKESEARSAWEKQWKEHEEYYLGKQFSGPVVDKDRPMVDNVIFEAVETFLPQATRRNPEPVVALDSTETNPDGSEPPEKSAYVLKVKTRLSDIADTNKLRLKLKRAARHWTIYLFGVAKMGWDLDRNMPLARVIRPQRVILDPEASIDEDGYNGGRIGEYRKMEAGKILDIIGEREDELDPATGEVKTRGNGEARKKIKELVSDNLATEIQFIEWWTPTYLCWTLDKTVLLKKKNPHWNYDRVETPNPELNPTDIASEGVSVDGYGNTAVQPVEIKGINHFPSPRMPYIFLSVFNLGDQPMDKTSLIGQNLANQDLINKRNKQIDKNADKMNGGAVVSLGRSGLTQAQAKNVVDAVRKGGAVLIPDGVPQEAIYFPQVPSLPGDVYTQLQDTRIRLRDIFGVSGSSQSGLRAEKTVRGKIIGRSADTDRIGGGVSEYLEQMADDIYNWFLQLEYVYDPKFQFINGGIPPKIKVTVKEGSLLPKDSISIANQALELANLNRISNLDLYKRLEWPNPEEVAANAWLETNAPELLYQDNPKVQQAVAMKQAAAAQAAQAEMDAEMMKAMAKGGAGAEEAAAGDELDETAELEGGGSTLSEVPEGAIV